MKNYLIKNIIQLTIILTLALTSCADPSAGTGVPTFFTDAKTVSAGYSHTAAIKTDGTLWTWGDNTYGQLGDGTTMPKKVAVRIGDEKDWAVVSTGLANESHTVAIKKDGRLFAWGYNGQRQFGDGTYIDSNTPVYIASDWLAVSAGFWYTVAINKDGKLFAWGYNNYGQLGDGKTGDKDTPISSAGDDWMAVSAGSYHTAAIKKDGRLFAWGYNNYGQLGDGTAGDKDTPTYISSAGDDWIAVSVCSYHTAAIKKDGRLFTWGLNDSGQIGDGTNTSSNTPVHITSVGDDWASVSCGESHTVAIKKDGRLFAWGSNTNGQLGDGTNTNSNTPVYISSAKDDWIAVSAGGYHTVAIKRDGVLWAWGRNEYGQLGDNSTTDRLIPRRVRVLE